MEVAIIGTGHVGKNIGTALLRARHSVIYGSRDPAKAQVPNGAKVTGIEEAVRKADVVFVAVPYLALKDIAGRMKKEKLENKTIVDVTNIIGQNFEWALGFHTSGAEELAKMLPKAKVVKAFNTVLADNMSTGKVGSEKLTLPIAGDDPSAKQKVRELAEQIGFEAVDAGDLKVARYLEPLGMLMIQLGYGMKMGTGIGLKLVRQE